MIMKIKISPFPNRIKLKDHLLFNNKKEVKVNLGINQKSKSTFIYILNIIYSHENNNYDVSDFDTEFDNSIECCIYYNR